MKLMKNVNKLLILSLLNMVALSSLATTVDDIVLTKSPAYRLGTSQNIEKEYSVIDVNTQETAKISTYDKEYLKNITYSDASIKDLSKEVSKLIDLDKSEMLEDIQILWAGTASKSETIKFALYKLSNPDADKPNESIVKKIIRPLASFSSIAGSGFMTPAAATSALMSGSLINSLSFNDKDLNYKYTKVNDADMIVLVKKVDDLQKRMINDYYDYMTSIQLVKMSSATLKKRLHNYELAKTEPNESLLIADAYYRVALDNKAKAELEFLSQRAALEQLVGPDALKEFEQKLRDREEDNAKK